MYEEFFGLNASPFELSPDPFFMFPSEQSREALTSIVHAVNRRKGFVVMTGEVGTGKTMMLRCLFELWETEQIPFAYFIGPRLSTIDFLSYITLELGITVAEPSKGNLLRALYGFLLTQFERGLTTVLVIDEAHQIPRRVLEEIRLLTNFETAQQKLVQILLVGQPELDAKLDSPDLRSLKQRIAVRCRLEPLRKQDVSDYIHRRLEIAGATPAGAAAIFPAETVDSVFRYSHGIPRLVNNICDQALSAAFAQQTHVVSPGIIEHIATHFRLNPEKPSKPSEKSVLRPTPVETPLPVSWSRPASSVFNGQSMKAEQFAPVQNRDLNADPPAYASMLSEADISAVINDVEEAYPHEPIASMESDSAPPTASEPEVAEVVQPRALYAQAAASVIAASPVPSPIVPPAVSVDAQVKDVPRKPLATISAIDQTPAPPANTRVSFRFEQPERDGFSLQKFMRGLLRSSFRLSIVMGAAALVAVGLAAGVSMARHPKAVVVTVPAPAKSALGDSQAVATLRPVAVGAAGLVDPLNSLESGTGSRPAPSAGVVAHAAPHANVVATKLLKPRLKSSIRLPTSNEPPSIAASAGDLDLGKTLPDIAAPNALLRGAGTGGHLEKPRLLSSPAPAYPRQARAANVQGIVVIDAYVDETGKVSEMKVISGSVMLTQAALDALRTWKYAPARLNGEPIAMHTQVSLNFNLH